MLNFKEWLISEGSNPGSKTGLYPPGYGGIALYPPQWYLTRSADAIFYLSTDDRIYNYKTKQMADKTINAGEGGMWDIRHLPGDTQKSTAKQGWGTNNGEGGMWNIKHLKGRPTYTKNKDLVPDEGEGGIWNIKHIPGSNSSPKNTVGEGGQWDITKIKGQTSKFKSKDFVPNSGEGGMWDIKNIK